ncbi:hypothetical protein, partial [Salmonella enterica]|uniref:hypothetical protein n=1 Tax=Salmonella enterica TaxID=28901 RepID=UPI003CF3E6CA
FRKVVRFLREQRLIDAEKTPGSTTRYSIRMPALKALADPGNPLAENAKQGRRQPPFPASSVTVAPPGRSTKNTRVGNRHAGRV